MYCQSYKPVVVGRDDIGGHLTCNDLWGSSNNLWRSKAWFIAVYGFVFMISLLGWGGVKDEPFVFSGAQEMWIVNSLSGSAALFLVSSIMGFAMHQISSSGWMLRWLVKLSYPIYVFHLMFVISVKGL